MTFQSKWTYYWFKETNEEGIDSPHKGKKSAHSIILAFPKGEEDVATREDASIFARGASSFPSFAERVVGDPRYGANISALAICRYSIVAVGHGSDFVLRTYKVPYTPIIAWHPLIASMCMAGSSQRLANDKCRGTRLCLDLPLASRYITIQ